MASSGSFWMPEQGSTIAADVDTLFDFIYYLNVIFFVLITAATIYFVVKYKRKSDDQLASSNVGHNTALEAAWTFVPLVLVIICFVWGFRVFLDQSVAPANAIEVQVKAERWKWDFQYSNGSQTLNELFAPAGRPVKLVMSAKDVLHSFFVPEFRIKSDVVPNRYTSVWFEAKEPGDYQIYCTEYCGTGHSNMLATVKVLPADEFDKAMLKGEWPGQSGEGRDPVEWGKELYVSKTCNACHSVNGSRLVGPSFKGLFGRDAKFADGSTAKADENYIRESIMDPNAKIVEGYAPAMPSFAGQLSDGQTDALIAYIKSLK